MFNCIFLKGICSEDLSLEDQEARDPVGENRPSHRRVLQFLLPEVPRSPGGLPSSLRVLTPAGQSTPLTSPIQVSVITPTPGGPATPSLEWDYSEVREDQEVSLIGGIRRLESATDPNLLEAIHIPIVSTDVSSLESGGVEESLEEVFARASLVKSTVMSAPDMDAERKEIKRLISGAQAEMEVNPVEFMQPGEEEHMNSVWDGLDKTYRSCVVKFEEWQDEYQSILDTNVETALQASVTRAEAGPASLQEGSVEQEGELSSCSTTYSW